MPNEWTTKTSRFYACKSSKNPTMMPSFLDLFTLQTYRTLFELRWSTHQLMVDGVKLICCRASLAVWTFRCIDFSSPQALQSARASQSPSDISAPQQHQLIKMGVVRQLWSRFFRTNEVPCVGHNSLQGTVSLHGSAGSGTSLYNVIPVYPVCLTYMLFGSLQVPFWSLVTLLFLCCVQDRWTMTLVKMLLMCFPVPVWGRSIGYLLFQNGWFIEKHIIIFLTRLSDSSLCFPFSAIGS